MKTEDSNSLCLRVRKALLIEGGCANKALKEE